MPSKTSNTKITLKFYSGGKISKFFMLIFILLILLVVLYNSFTVYIKPNEVGIKERKIGIKRGLLPDLYQPGLAFVIPFGIEKIHRLPVNIQIFEMTNYPSKYLSARDYDRAAHIQTSDGFFVDVDITILYKIVDPYRTITTIGPGNLYLTNGIMPKAEPIMKEAMGELTTEEFYNSFMRYEKTLLAKELLNKELNPKGIQVEEVLVRYFKYSDEIQKNIEDKKLKDQLVFKNQAEARAAAEEANLKKVIQEGEAKVKVKLQEGAAYVTKRNAEKELYVRKKMAEADLLVKLAEARKTELKNEAMKVEGSDKLVGLKMAEVLKGLELIILTSDGDKGLNPLNLSDALNLFGVAK